MYCRVFNARTAASRSTLFSTYCIAWNQHVDHAWGSESHALQSPVSAMILLQCEPRGEWTLRAWDMRQPQVSSERFS